MLLALEEMVFQGTSDKIIEVGSCYGMEMRGEKTKVMRISWRPSALEIMMDQKQPVNVEYFNYLGSTVTFDARRTREIKSRVAMARVTFNKKKEFSPSNWI